MDRAWNNAIAPWIERNAFYYENGIGFDQQQNSIRFHTLFAITKEMLGFIWNKQQAIAKTIGL